MHLSRTGPRAVRINADAHRYEAPSAPAANQYDAPTRFITPRLEGPTARRDVYRAPSAHTAITHIAPTSPRHRETGA